MPAADYQEYFLGKLQFGGKKEIAKNCQVFFSFYPILTHFSKMLRKNQKFFTGIILAGVSHLPSLPLTQPLPTTPSHCVLMSYYVLIRMIVLSTDEIFS